MATLITSSKEDDRALTEATEQAASILRNKYLCNLPSNWDIECGDKCLTFDDIKQLLIKRGLSAEVANKYFGLDCCIVSDAPIIYLDIYENHKVVDRKPLFIGEIKKQGTNDKRIAEGKKKQAIGNAAPDRVAKNFVIAASYSYLCDMEFFPYNVFLHGCDFNFENITKTTKSKLEPFFGELNKFNPWFDKNMIMLGMGTHGGSCYYQNDRFTEEQLINYICNCGETGIKHYLSKYKE